MGPELNEKKCWLVSDNTEGIEIFDKSQEQCKSGIKWLEYRKGKWQPLWLYRMSDYGNIPDTEGENKLRDLKFSKQKIKIKRIPYKE